MIFGNDEMPDFMVDDEKELRDTLLKAPRVHQEVVYKKSVQFRSNSEDLSHDDSSQGSRHNKEELEHKHLQKVKNKD